MTSAMLAPFRVPSAAIPAASRFPSGRSPRVGTWPAPSTASSLSVAAGVCWESCPVGRPLRAAGVTQRSQGPLAEPTRDARRAETTSLPEACARVPLPMMGKACRRQAAPCPPPPPPPPPPTTTPFGCQLPGSLGPTPSFPSLEMARSPRLMLPPNPCESNYLPPVGAYGLRRLPRSRSSREGRIETRMTRLAIRDPWS